MHFTSYRRASGLAAAAALAFGMAVALVPPAAAAPATAPTASAPSLELAPSAPPKRAPVGIAAGGNRSYDIDLDGWQDLTARHAATSQLNVYRHSQSFNGTATFRASVTTSYGWNVMSWITPGYVNNDGAPDILARHLDGRLFAYPHSGTFNGTATFTAPTLLGSGWNMHDVLFLDDWDVDGFDDILARPAGSDELWIYFHSGTFNGTSTYQAAQLVLAEGASTGNWFSMADVTGDDITDLIFRTYAGELAAFDFTPPGGASYLLGWEWNINDRLTMNDVDGDGDPDVIARRAGDGTLHAYPHRGTFDPGNPVATYQAPVLLGYGWNINDIIN